MTDPYGKKWFNKHQKPTKAIHDFVCLWCGARFEYKPDKDEHQEWCKQFGLTYTPRHKPKDK